MSLAGNCMPDVAITKRDTYKRVQSLIKVRVPKIIHPGRVGSDYLLSGLIRCGICGKELIPIAGESMPLSLSNQKVRASSTTSASPFKERRKV